MTQDAVTHEIVDRDEWLQARIGHLQAEKEFTRRRDELSRERRALPWLEITEDYRFTGPNGAERLTDLFAGRSQLIVYHFMFGPGWVEGCPSCSFWADNFDGIGVHLEHRDTTLVAISRAPLEEIEAYRSRMGWTSFNWLSSSGSGFNFGTQAFDGDEAAGISVFGLVKFFV